MPSSCETSSSCPPNPNDFLLIRPSVKVRRGNGSSGARGCCRYITVIPQCSRNMRVRCAWEKLQGTIRIPASGDLPPIRQICEDDPTSVFVLGASSGVLILDCLGRHIRWLTAAGRLGDDQTPRFHTD